MNQDLNREIQKRVQGLPIGGGRGNKFGRITFDDLVFVPAQLAKRPVDYYSEKIESKTIIGKSSQAPIELETPIIIGAMSFGALNKENKTALALASNIVGTCANTGEGGMLPEERKYAKYLIAQYASGRFGVDEEYLKQADAIEIKIGQGSKPGSGGFLPGIKVTEEIAKIRKKPAGQDIHSPAYHLDIKNIDDLKKRVEWLREVTQGVPIIIKLAAGDIENDIKLAVQANPDIIAIDGMEGGCGAAPQILMDEVGIPALPALVRARLVLDKIGARQELWIAGGLNKGGEVAKALALGADAVFLGTALIMAMGSPLPGELAGNLKLSDFPEVQKEIREKAQKVASFIKNCTEEIKLVAGACGENNIHKLSQNHLRALNSEIAKITKIKLCSE